MFSLCHRCIFPQPASAPQLLASSLTCLQLSFVSGVSTPFISSCPCCCLVLMASSFEKCLSLMLCPVLAFSLVQVNCYSHTNISFCLAFLVIKVLCVFMGSCNFFGSLPRRPTSHAIIYLILFYFPFLCFIFLLSFCTLVLCTFIIVSNLHVLFSCFFSPL